MVCLELSLISFRDFLLTYGQVIGAKAIYAWNDVTCIRNLIKSKFYSHVI